MKLLALYFIGIPTVMFFLMVTADMFQKIKKS